MTSFTSPVGTNLKPRLVRTWYLPNNTFDKRQNRDKSPQQDHAIHKHMHSMCLCVYDSGVGAWVCFFVEPECIVGSQFHAEREFDIR